MVYNRITNTVKEKYTNSASFYYKQYTLRCLITTSCCDAAAAATARANSSGSIAPRWPPNARRSSRSWQIALTQSAGV